MIGVFLCQASPRFHPWAISGLQKACQWRYLNWIWQGQRGYMQVTGYAWQKFLSTHQVTTRGPWISPCHRGTGTKKVVWTQIGHSSSKYTMIGSRKAHILSTLQVWNSILFEMAPFFAARDLGCWDIGYLSPLVLGTLSTSHNDPLDSVSSPSNVHIKSQGVY